METICPHCKLFHDGVIITHCLDNKAWSKAERDALREQIRRGYPGTAFTKASDRL